MICQSAANDLFHDAGESLRIGYLAVVTAKCLLIDVTEQVESFARNLGSADAALQECPKVAASVYEAAVLALAEFRQCGFADATFGPATRLTIRVRNRDVKGKGG